MRRTVVLAIGLWTALSITLGLASAHAHHGWGYYDTRAPIYLVGNVLAVNWRNPHPSVTIQAAPASVPEDWSKLPIPPELSALNFGATLAKTSAITHARIWTLDLAPINRLENWGMPRAPRIGDAITAIAFPACTEDGVARPALIILDSVGVRQQSVALPAGCSSR